MEVTLIWSWFSFWMGVLATVGVSFVTFLAFAIAQYRKKNRYK